MRQLVQVLVTFNQLGSPFGHSGDGMGCSSNGISTVHQLAKGATARFRGAIWTGEGAALNFPTQS